jgi:hypothetical protein
MNESQVRFPPFSSEKTFRVPVQHPGFKFFHPRSMVDQRLKRHRIPYPDRNKELYFTPKILKLSSRKYYPEMFFFRIPDLDFFPSPILDPGVKKATDPGSATLVYSRTYLRMDAEILSWAECEAHHTHILLHLSLKQSSGNLNKANDKKKLRIKTMKYFRTRLPVALEWHLNR